MHIDVDVYDSARDTLEWAWPRLSVGGVVVFDDYGSFECEGVATLGRQLFALDLQVGRLVHNLNGHLLLFKLTDGPLAGDRRRPLTALRPYGVSRRRPRTAGFW